MFKKILLIFILAMSVVRCSLFDPELWNEASRQRREQGRKCYENENGYFYCKNKYGNRVY